MPFPDSNEPSQRHEPAPTVLSGRKIVIAMFLFGITATATLWIYWRLHVGPFLPLQRAIANEFEGSSPRVEGGQRKKHEHTPRILRVIMKVDFNPNENDQRSNAIAEHVTALAKQYQDLKEYDIFDIYLVQPVAEERHVERHISQKTADM